MSTKRKLVPAVAIFDIETNNLNGDFGQILCVTIKEYGEHGPMITLRCDEYPGYAKAPWDDRQLCMDMRDELERYDEIAGYNSVFFDVTYLNTRLAYWGEKMFQSPKHRDLLFIVKRNMRLHNNRLASVQSHFQMEVEKTTVSFKYWTYASRGAGLPEGKIGMDYIVDHCEKDVLMTEELWSLMSPFVKKVW